MRGFIFSSTRGSPQRLTLIPGCSRSYSRATPLCQSMPKPPSKTATSMVVPLLEFARLIEQPGNMHKRLTRHVQNAALMWGEARSAARVHRTTRRLLKQVAASAHAHNEAGD